MTTFQKVASTRATTVQEAQVATTTSSHKPFATKAVEVLKLFANGTWAWGN